jgi:hypothetical protein
MFTGMITGSVPTGPSETINSGESASKTAHPAAETTTDAPGDDVKPPLTKSQTAGIAIAGTTCLLMAVVAGLFLARRYHTGNAMNRKSTGVYPEVAYIYDPDNHNDDAEAARNVPPMAMSGGAAGFASAPAHAPTNSTVFGAGPIGNSAVGGAAHAPTNSTIFGAGPIGNNAYGGVAVPARASTASSLSQNRYSTGSLAVYNAAAGKRHSTGSVSRTVSPNPFSDPSEYAALAANPYTFNPVTKEYPTLSPYGSELGSPVAGFAKPQERDSNYTDPFADPFEHDLLLNVDMRSETPDSILVVAPPPTPRGQQSPYGRYAPEHTNASNASLVPPPLGRYTPSISASSNGPPTPGRGTPDIAFPARTASPVHKGWADIKNDFSAVPAPLSFPSIHKKPVPQRKQTGEGLLSGAGQPLTMKRKEVGSGAKSLEVPTSMYGAPGPMIDDHEGNNHTVYRKRSGELLFADPLHIGRSF